MAKGKKKGVPRERESKREILSRTVKWEILTHEQPGLEQSLLRLSDDLREYEHWALEVEHSAYEAYKAEKLAASGVKPNVKSFLTDFDLYSRYMPLRDADKEANLGRATLPANWVLESCFRKVSAAYKSWFELMERGDPDARSIKPSDEWHFVAIQGALTQTSIKRYESGRYLVLAPKIFPGLLEFKIPEKYQARLLANAKRLAKFVISRRESDLREPGCYWVSVSYEIEKPETVPFIPEEATYIAFGASSVGVLWNRPVSTYDPAAYWGPKIADIGRRIQQEPKKSVKRGQLRSAVRRMHKGFARDRATDWCEGEWVIGLARPDKQLMPHVEEIAAKMREVREHPRHPEYVEESLRKLGAARRRRFAVMAADQTHDRRTQVAELIRKLGPHFVVTEYDIRSKEGKLADSSKPERGGSTGLNFAAQNTGTMGYFGQWLETKIAEFGGAVHWHRLPPEALPKSLPKGHENKIIVARALRDHFLATYEPAEAT